MEWEKLLKWMSLKLAAESTTKEDTRMATGFLEETKVGSIKYNRGRYKDGHWVFGGD